MALVDIVGFFLFELFFTNIMKYTNSLGYANIIDYTRIVQKCWSITFTPLLDKDWL